MEEQKEILKRRLSRLKEKRDNLEGNHKGNELAYTYWAGYNLGYLKGKIAEIENIIDEYNKPVDRSPTAQEIIQKLNKPN